MRLFEGSLSDYQDEAIADALSRIESLSEREIVDVSHHDLLESIMREVCIEPAQLVTSQMRGKRRTETSHYGRHEEHEEKWEVVDVSIPFTGDGDSFELASCEVDEIVTPCRVDHEKNLLIVAFSDDDDLKTNVNELIEQVNHGLEQLKRELVGYPERIRQSASDALKKRCEKIMRRRARDEDLDFPLTDFSTKRTFEAATISERLGPTEALSN